MLLRIARMEEKKQILFGAKEEYLIYQNIIFIRKWIEVQKISGIKRSRVHDIRHSAILLIDMGFFTISGSRESRA